MKLSQQKNNTNVEVIRVGTEMIKSRLESIKSKWDNPYIV